MKGPRRAPVERAAARAPGRGPAPGEAAERHLGRVEGARGRPVFVSARRTGRGRRPLVVPPVVTGFLLLRVFGRRGALGAFLEDVLGITLAFRWTGAAVAAAVMGFPLMVRAIRLAIEQIDPAIEEASVNLGADSGYTFRRVTLPLISSALLAGMIFSFTRNMTQISAIIFLVSPRWKLLTKEVLDLVELGYLGDAIALITVLVGIVLVAIGLLYFGIGRWTRGRDREVVALQAGD